MTDKKSIKAGLVIMLVSGVALANTSERSLVDSSSNLMLKKTILKKMTDHIWQQKRALIHEIDINKLQIHYSVYKNKNNTLLCTSFFKQTKQPNSTDHTTGSHDNHTQMDGVIAFDHTMCQRKNSDD